VVSEVKLLPHLMLAKRPTPAERRWRKKQRRLASANHSNDDGGAHACDQAKENPVPSEVAATCQRMRVVKKGLSASKQKNAPQPRREEKSRVAPGHWKRV